MRVVVVDSIGNVVAEIKGVKTIRGARSKLTKSSIAFRSNWTIRIEERVG